MRKAVALFSTLFIALLGLTALLVFYKPSLETRAPVQLCALQSDQQREMVIKQLWRQGALFSKFSCDASTLSLQLEGSKPIAQEIMRGVRGRVGEYEILADIARTDYREWLVFEGSSPVQIAAPDGLLRGKGRLLIKREGGLALFEADSGERLHYFSSRGGFSADRLSAKFGKEIESVRLEGGVEMWTADGITAIADVVEADPRSEEIDLIGHVLFVDGVHNRTMKARAIHFNQKSRKATSQGVVHFALNDDESQRLQQLLERKP